MRERGIIFSGPMVRAILEERKLQTRRVMNPQPFLAEKQDAKWWLLDRSEDGYGKTNGAWKDGDQPFWAYCPYGKPGDRLWVRETLTNPRNGDCWTSQYHYAEGGAPSGMYSTKDRPGSKPAIHMPRWASRILLEITQVRVERVQEITEEDALAEGCERHRVTEEDVENCQISDASPLIKQLAKAFGPGGFTAKNDFCHLWDSINSKRGFGWEINPWVWAITFKRVHP